MVLEPFVEDMGVNLGGRNVGMPQQCLHHAQVGAILQEMAGKGMSQHVRADGVGTQAALRRQRSSGRAQNAGASDGRSRRKTETAISNRRRSVSFSLRAIIRHCPPCGIVERHQTLLAALAAHHQHALIAPRRRCGQGDEFGDAQAGRIQQFKQAIEPRGALTFGTFGPRALSRAVTIRRSTSAMRSTFGSGRPRFGPSRIAAGSSPRFRSAYRKR